MSADDSASAGTDILSDEFKTFLEPVTVASPVYSGNHLNLPNLIIIFIKCSLFLWMIICTGRQFYLMPNSTHLFTITFDCNYVMLVFIECFI